MEYLSVFYVLHQFSNITHNFTSDKQHRNEKKTNKLNELMLPL